MGMGDKGKLNMAQCLGQVGNTQFMGPLTLTLALYKPKAVGR